MIVRAAILGLLAWFAATLSFRLYGQIFFAPDPGGHLTLFIAAPIVAIGLTWVAMKLLRVQPGDEGEAAVAIALPGMVLDAYAVSEFATVYPNLDPTLDGTFGALMLVAHAAILFAGLLFTQLAPQDERL